MSYLPIDRDEEYRSNAEQGQDLRFFALDKSPRRIRWQTINWIIIGTALVFAIAVYLYAVYHMVPKRWF
jgi:hypothetical protein